MASKQSPPSYWHTPSDQPLRWITIPQFIDHWAEKSPQKEAYVVRMNGHPREAVTFAELKEKTEAIAAALLQLGLAPGDFVMIAGITCINWILVDLACASIGVITIRCRISALTKEGLLHTANTNSVKALFYHPGESGELLRHLSKCLPEAFQGKQCSSIPSLRHVINLAAAEGVTTAAEGVTTDASRVTAADGVTTLKDLIKKPQNLDAMRAIKTKVNPESFFTIYMTSGSTGFPKAIPLRHFQVVNQLMLSQRAGPFRKMKSSDRFFNDRALSWAGSFMHNSIIMGCCTVYLHPLAKSQQGDMDFLLDVLKSEQITCGLIMKYLLADLLKHFHSRFLRWAIIAGEVLTSYDIQRLGKMSEEVSVAYGSTETFGLASFVGTEEAVAMANTQYAGRIMYGTEVKIVDGDGCVVPMGCKGEIVARSSVAFRGYLQKEARGMRVDELGWIHTQDAGSLHDGGLLKVFGRKSDEISRGALFIYPAVVEKFIMGFPGVFRVAVVGVPDARLGQDICACIIPQAGTALREEDMRRCFDDLYQTEDGMGITPGYFLFLEQFPIVNGKTDRRALVRMASRRE